MNRELIVECTPDLIRAALFEDGKLCEIHRERVRKKKLTDSLFLGRVKSIRPSVGAAFVDIGEELQAFLPLQEGMTLKCGDDLIVQGAAVQSVDTKGLRISTKINLAGKWLVLVPGDCGVRISKKIKDPALRAALSELVEPICPEGCGMIVRTASEDVTESALSEEGRVLEQRWKQVQFRAKGMTHPGLLYEPSDLIERLVRDLGATLSRVVVNDQAAYFRIMDYVAEGWIKNHTSIEFFSEEKQLMNDVFSLDAQVDKALRRRVWLDCGGYIVFDFCEALTVIDVNSGKMVLGRDSEDTALRVNLEAAEEIARQLRIRDIGGIIVVDYIDMTEEAHQAQLLKTIRDEAKKDRSPVSFGNLTKFGLIEMVRRRKGEQIGKALQTSCRVCGGSGMLLSSEEAAFRVLRQLRRMIISAQRGPFLVRCSAQVSDALAEMTCPDTESGIYVMAETGRAHERFEISQADIYTALPKGAVQLRKG